MSDKPRDGLTRREFLRGGLGTGLSLGLAGALWGAKGARAQQPPSDKLAGAVIGVGGMGTGHLGALLGNSEVQVVAVCDPDAGHLKAAVGRTRGAARGYRDYRELLDREDLDFVSIATPDHWHATIAIDACRAGCDVYVEKPMTLTIGEGQALVQAARLADRVVQLGTQQRAGDHWRRVVELVRNGAIGEVQRVRAWIAPRRHTDWSPDAEPPRDLDWDLWLGPAPYVPYNPQRCHYKWRFFWDYGNGLMGDWGVHHIDIVHWAMGADRPISVEARGNYPDGAYGDVPMELEVHYEYPGYRLDWTQLGGQQWDPAGSDNGIRFYGSEADLFVNRGGYRILTEGFREPVFGPNDFRLPRVRSHWHDFLSAVRNRTRPTCDVLVGHRSTVAPLLGNIAFRVGARLEWDGEAERFLGNPAADRLLHRPPRAPYVI